MSRDFFSPVNLLRPSRPGNAGNQVLFRLLTVLVPCTRDPVRLLRSAVGPFHSSTCSSFDTRPFHAARGGRPSGPLAETTWRKRKCGLLSCGLVKAFLGNAPAAPSAAAHAPPRSVECESDGNASGSITGFWQSLEGLCSDGTVGRTMYRAALGVASNQLDCYRAGLKSKEENRTGTF